MPRTSKLTLFHDLIGTVPDREIAVMAGCSIATVCHFRKRHDIPSFRSRLSSEARAQVGSTALVPHTIPKLAQVATASPPQAYRATVETGHGAQDYIVIGGSFVQAAQKATTKGEVRSMAYLGLAIV